MTQTSPRVSVLMAVYNGQRFLDEAIDSILWQDFADLELIIIDDGSTDGTPAMIQRWAERDQRVVVIRFDANRGIPHAVNAGLEIARGEYVMRHDADDVCIRGRIHLQVTALDRDPSVVVVATGYDLIDPAGHRVGGKKPFYPPEVIDYLLHFSNVLGGNGQVMFRRDSALAVGGYDRELDLSQDYDLWARLSRVGRMVVLPVIGMRHRMHGGRISVTRRDRQQQNSRKIARRMLSELLDRDLTDAEAEAVAVVWRQVPRPGQGALADRVLWEAFARFARDNTAPLRRSVRVATASRFVLTAAMLAYHRHPLSAVRLMLLAVRWHPWGIVVGSREIISRLVVRLRRRLSAERYETAPRSNSVSPFA